MADVRNAVLDRLRELPETVSLYEFAPLVTAGHDQHQIVNVLFRLTEEKIVELLPGNRLRVLKAP